MKRTPLEFIRRRTWPDENVKVYYIRQRLLKMRRRKKKSPHLGDASEDFFADKYVLRKEVLPPKEPFDIRVRCCGALHRVSIVPAGAVTWHHHTAKEREALEVLRGLGDKTCGCLDVVKRLSEDGDKKYSASRRTITLRRLLPHQWSSRPNVTHGLDMGKEHRVGLIANRIIAVLTIVGKNISGFPPYVGLKDFSIGIADATHPAGLRAVSREKYEPGRGWVSAPGLLRITVPLDYVLRLLDNTHVVQGHIVFGWKWGRGTNALATVAVRKDAETFALEEHAVNTTDLVTWTFNREPVNWRPLP